MCAHLISKQYTARFELDTHVYTSFCQAGVYFLRDKEASAKSSWKAIEFWREHQRFSHVPRVRSTSTDRKRWVGMCLQSPIQWNWFHPATPRSWELLISQVWNCSERSSRRGTSGSGGKDWKVDLKLADIWCILLLQSINCHRNIPFFLHFWFTLLLFNQLQANYSFWSCLMLWSNF